MEDRVSMNLAANVRRSREALGLTQNRLADLSGIPRPTIANLESGTANPTLSVLLRVAESLGTSMEALVGSSPPRVVVSRVDSLPVRKRTGTLVRRLFPIGQGPLEFERLELAPNAKLAVRLEPQGAREVVTCESGELSVTFGEDVVHLTAGDVATVGADAPRQFENTARRATVAYRLLLPRSG